MKPDEQLDKLSFEEALQQLEQTVEALDRGELRLEEALVHYERGVALLRRCRQLLEHAEKRVMELVGINEGGEAVVRPFEIAEEEANASYTSLPTDAQA